MPNALTSTGLTIVSQAEELAIFTAAYKMIYGSDIKLDPETPDAQMMMIYIQVLIDNAELIQQVYTSFDPDQAFGVILDQRVALSGIQRQGGTFTTTPVNLTITGTTTLYGLDQNVQPVYTVSDTSGNQWELQYSQYGTPSNTFTFESVTPGNQIVTPGTIKVPVTINIAVTAVNNPGISGTIYGQAEESDPALKIRRQQSVTIGSMGFA